MKQILQNLGNGETMLAEVPSPRRSRGNLLCHTTRTLVSLGTEKMLIDFGKGSWIEKARSQPDKVKQVLQKIKTDGLIATIETVRAKLDTPIPLGYCHVGKVIEADNGSGFAVGDRIISNGPHAEVVSVPENLAAKLPGNVTDEQASFVVVGAIGLQGIRLLAPTLGERIAVFGLGLIGLLTVQMLRANGCQVLGIDFDEQKLKLAESYGAETVNLSAGQDPVKVAQQWTGGVGVDGVLVTASTKSNDLIHQAATMCRKRGRIVLVGVIGLNLQRADFYEKELSFQVSCSYGPGRYEGNYEQKGLDYPIGFVRWTEQRNFEAVIDLMASGQLETDALITHRYVIDQALEGYQAISEKGAMGILLQYPEMPEPQSKPTRCVSVTTNHLGGTTSPVTVGFIGAGGFTTRMLLPLLPKTSVRKKTIVSSKGVSSFQAAKKFGFEQASSDSAALLADDDVNVVFITTPHNTHANMVCDALSAGKHVFVEKPLAMNQEELERVAASMDANPDRCLMVGFNRRFSPHISTMKSWLDASPGARSIIITVNAGEIPADHWLQDPEVGGGRIIGEGCHFIDLARFLADSPIEMIHAVPMRGPEGRLGDTVSIQLGFANGSMASVLYLANGSKDFPKERIEVFAGGKVYQCDNFRVTREIGGKRKLKTRAQDKGHAKELEEFVQTIIGGGGWPISASELLEVSQFTIDANNEILNSLAAFSR